jgi:chromosome segregation ATPase
MPTNDRFIQSIVELLDKLIDHQTKSSNLLTEIKSSSNELRSEVSEALRHLREKLPETITATSEESTHRLLTLANRIEETSEELASHITLFNKSKHELEAIVRQNTENVVSSRKVIDDISTSLTENKSQKEEMEKTLKDIQGFLLNLRSKKAWVALLVAAIVGAATFVSAITNAIEVVRKKMTPDPIKQVSPTNSAPSPVTTPSTVPPKTP